jgi:hypothetical protein
MPRWLIRTRDCSDFLGGVGSIRTYQTLFCHRRGRGACPVGTGDAELIEALREKAEEIGANGIYVLGRADQLQPQQLMFNPFLGGYQTLGGNTLPVIKAAALRWE